VENGAGATVVLMADPTSAARFGMQTRCDPDGRFSIRDIPPGRYTAVALTADSFERVQFDAAGLLSRVDSRGERVQVDAGASSSVTLKVN
jgi:hypothetical protein